MPIPIEPHDTHGNLSVESTTSNIRINTYDNLGHHLGPHECGHGPR